MMSPRTSRVWFWALTAAALLYTALLSWWSPLTSDTYHHALTGMEHCFSFSLVWERCVASYMTWNPRIGEYLAFAVATAGKWLFMLLNPFVQVGLALMMFYLASGRRVDPRSWPDVRLFGLGLLLLFFLLPEGLALRLTWIILQTEHMRSWQALAAQRNG